ncbi:hypothetical protein [Eubacterium sp.]|uniref:hypothetical protein n=1 Tax=Eubacterium sp. TaxID=142586 RepID=UPI0035226F13
MREKYIHDIYNKKIEHYEGYESFCYQNCQRIILEYIYGSKAVLFINTVPSIEIEVGDKLKLRGKSDFRSLLPSINKYAKRIYYTTVESVKDIFKRNIKFIYENNSPIIVGADTYFLPYTANYKKSHAKHTLILCGFDLTRNVVYVIDWYSPWFYKGEVDIETFLQARNSKNEKDDSYYSGSPIENNWAYIEKIPQYSADKLFDETIKLSKKFYFNNSDNGVIAALSLLLKHISVMENETDYNRVFYYMYTLLNRKKIFLQYIEYYSNLKQLDRNIEFIAQLKKNVANWDVIVILLLKQSKRYNVKTRNHLIDKIRKSISEESIMIQTIEKLF